MLFRKIIFSALLIGIISGLLFSAVQFIGVSPIIFAAEQYEVAEPEVETVPDHHHGEAASSAHHHDAEAWGPEDGLERSLYTLLSYVLAGIGFAAVLLAIMSQLQLNGVTRLSVVKGLAWGVAGFIAFFAAPGIGLPPEIPGIEAAPLEYRQSWWMLAVVASGIGIGVLAFAKGFFKAAGLLLIAIPYLIGAPHPAGPEFTHPDANAVAILSDLHQQFIIASGVSNLIFWLALGALCAWALNRQVLDSEHAQA